MERFIYLFSNLFVLPVILFFSWKRPDLRSKIVVMGILAGFLGPVSEFWFRQDYWQPKYALGWPLVIEDFLFGFLCGSGPSVAYQVFFRKKLGGRKSQPNHARLFFILGLGFSTMIVLNNFLKVNSILTCTIAFLIVSVVILSRRRDLIPASLATGFLTGLFGLIFYLLVLPLFPGYLTSVWILADQPLGKIFLGVPLTEIVWATGLGLVAGSLYEFWQGHTLVSLKPA